MSTPKDKIISYRKDLKTLSKEIDDMFAKQCIINKNIESEIDLFLSNEKTPLKESVWTVRLSERNKNLYLSDENETGFVTIRELLNVDYHISYTFFDSNFRLRFNDDELIIQQNGDLSILELIKYFNLDVVYDTDNQISEIDKQIKSLEEQKQSLIKLTKI